MSSPVLPRSTFLRMRSEFILNAWWLNNFSMIPLWSIPMAAVTGNTLILKPSERDPGAAMIIAELCQRAGTTAYYFPSMTYSRFTGLPPGVLNVVHGGVPTVNAICDHPDIKAVSFVGGDRAGRHIYERCLHS